jgi:glycosyltransferase involved in cell wall biosynthesis
MNILFVHEVDWLKKVVFEIHNLAETLSVRGHRVFVVDYDDTWKKDGIFDFGSCKTKKTENVSRAVPGSSVTLVHPGQIKIPGIGRVTGSINQYREIKKLLREEKIDVIMLYSVPTNGLQVMHLAKKQGIPVVFRSIDILHKLVRSRILGPATGWLEKRVYPGVDEILAITPNHARYVIGMGAPEAKVKFLPLPIDTSLFKPGVDCGEVKGKWGYTDSDKVIVFIGTLFHFSGLDGFIKELPRVLAKVPEAKLLIVGDGPQRSKLEQIISELKLKKYVTITGFQPYNTMPQYISLAALCINTFVNTKETADIFPGKILQYIAGGKAAVVTPLKGITCLIPDETQGVVYANSAAEMADKVAELLSNKEKRQKLERAGLDYIMQTHDQRKIGEQLEAELARIIKEKAARKVQP